MQPSYSKRSVSPSGHSTIAEIEILRAVAILLTLTQHLGYLLFPNQAIWDRLNHVAGFWTGVDLFFCISGFVICRSIYATWPRAGARQHWNATAAFWIRRFFRIAPTLWIWILFFLVCSKNFNNAGGFYSIDVNLGDAKAAILNYSNIHIFSCVIGDSSCGPNSVFWSLSLEEQFYALLPFALLFPARLLKTIVPAAILIQLPIHRMPWEPGFGGAMWFFRTDAILFGACIAYFSYTRLYARALPALLKTRKIRPVITIALLASLIFIPKSNIGVETGVIAIVSAILVVLASYDRQILFSRHKAMKPLVWIGSRSFSIYLMHMPIYWFINEIGYRFSATPHNFTVPLANNPFNPTLTIATIFCIAFAAEINFRIIETPMRNIGRRIAGAALEGRYIGWLNSSPERSAK
ncbi:acyltransferase family protein [Burkholderia territorii]|uniref:acyltransferase family protein n=1 Tax=Burkholderia territorii TaxID=1503055 RepID=UPI0009BD55BC|nr:acyltransferase [Burkholderia territorii]TXG22089.1 acyltransferase [Burkholderia territorii]HDR8859876.1 acyltransferase [Burkholderia territorii]HDR8863678.1 acyltransferase [Burkholderia territorii]HDR8868969.1 acyltransferase [Burkholderia territorii]HDR8876185.1 acyltransferase [Burkholderia territorii]